MARVEQDFAGIDTGASRRTFARRRSSLRGFARRVYRVTKPSTCSSRATSTAVALRQTDIRPVESEADWEAMAELQALDWKEARERNKEEPLEDIGKQMFAVNRAKQPPVQ